MAPRATSARNWWSLIGPLFRSDSVGVEVRHKVFSVKGCKGKNGKRLRRQKDGRAMGIKRISLRTTREPRSFTRGNIRAYPHTEILQFLCTTPPYGDAMFQRIFRAFNRRAE